MPHLIVEFSNNIVAEKNRFNELFQQAHAILVDCLPPAKINVCKSRAIECPIYYAGDGKPEKAFIHITLKILPGRTDAMIQQASTHLIQLFESHFSHSMEQLKLQITLEIAELSKHYYYTEFRKDK